MQRALAVARSIEEELRGVARRHGDRRPHRFRHACIWVAFALWAIVAALPHDEALRRIDAAL